MILSIFLTILTSINAGILPPGFVVRQFGHTRDKVDSIKVEERVVFGEDAFSLNETIYFLRPNYFKITAERSGELVTLTRKGSECEFSTAGKRISGINCSGLKSNFYYNILFPYGSEIDYFKSLNIDTKEGLVSIRKTQDGEYTVPEGTLIVRNDRSPMFVVGIDRTMYSAAVEELRSEKDMTSSILDNIKRKKPQIWLDKSDFSPLRIYGSKNSGDTVEIILSSYIKDAAEVPFPSKITLLVNDLEKASYSVRSFETGVKLNESFFGLQAQQGTDISSLSENKKKLIEYLKDYR